MTCRWYPGEVGLAWSLRAGDGWGDDRSLPRGPLAGGRAAARGRADMRVGLIVGRIALRLAGNFRTCPSFLLLGIQ